MTENTATQYQIRYNRTTNHIAGLTERTTGSELNYAQSACPVLTRTFNLAAGKGSNDLREIIAASENSGRKLCKHCEKAALLVIAEIEKAEAAAAIEVKEVQIVAPRTAHAECSHAATKTERAKCRKARAAK